MNQNRSAWKGLLALSLCASSFFYACQKSAGDVSKGLNGSDAVAAAAARKSKMDVPTLSVASATQKSISITVTAGTTGAPAGFSLQWVPKAYLAGPDGQLNTPDDLPWPASDDANLCKASFSGNANLSRYNLAANESVTVKVGDFLFDNGASTNCGDALACGTDYVFRAFAHANSSLQRSEFTSYLPAATLACGSTGVCTYTQGYWKTHGPVPTGNNANEWPEAVKTNGLTLGTVSYTADQLQAIFTTPAAGNGLIALAHQLIAARLNEARGADVSVIATALAAADQLIGSRVVPPVGTGSLKPALTGTLTNDLANYNEGGTGPGHCD